jgi:hypothetical protein
MKKRAPISARTGIVTPIPMPALAPALSPVEELSLDDNCGCDGDGFELVTKMVVGPAGILDELVVDRVEILDITKLLVVVINELVVDGNKIMNPRSLAEGDVKVDDTAAFSTQK